MEAAESSELAKSRTASLSPGAIMKLSKDLTKKKKERSLPKARKPKAYCPAPGTAPHALLITLYKVLVDEELDHLKKSQLVELAQPYCHSSFTLSENGSFYTAWNSMSQLVKKNLVNKEGNPARYSLTDAGKELAAKLAGTPNSATDSPEETGGGRFTAIQQRPSSKVQQPKRQPEHALSSSDDDESSTPATQLEVQASVNQSPPSPISTSEGSQPLDDSPQICLQPGSFTVFLCVDCAETTSGNTRGRKANLLPELKNQNVPVDVRKLHVGDFVWVARENVRYQRGRNCAPPTELVFDFVVERKRIDDLSHSIMDGRFHEQKARLKHCGLQKPVYLVEEFKLHPYLSVPRETLEQAISNTQFIDEFEVIRTRGLRDTVQYLSLMTRYLQTTYEGRRLFSRSREEEHPPSSCHLLLFDTFNKGSIKNKPLTVREMFSKQLCQLSGLSVDKVLAITEFYPTPSSLFEAYNVCISEEEKERLLANIKYGSSQRNIGPVISRALYHLYAVRGPLQ